MGIYGSCVHKLLEMYASPEAIEKMKNDIKDYEAQIKEYEDEKAETYDSGDKEAIDRIITRLRSNIEELNNKIEVAQYNSSDNKEE